MSTGFRTRRRQPWRQQEPVAERAVATITREVRDRDGVDLENGTLVDRDALEQAVRERQTAAVERRRTQGSGVVLEASLVLTADEANRAAGIVDEHGQAEPAAEIARPIELAHLVVDGLRRGAESDVAVHRAEVEHATTVASAAESAATRLEAQGGHGGGAPAGSTCAGQSAAVVQGAPDEAVRQAALVESGSTAAASARAVADRLNAKPVSAAPAAGKAAVRAPKPRTSADRTAERARGRRVRLAVLGSAGAAGLLLAGCGWTTDYAGDRDRARARASAEHARSNLGELVESSTPPTGPGLLNAVREAIPEEFDKVVVFDQELITDETARIGVAFDGVSQSGGGGTYNSFRARVCAEFTVTGGSDPELDTQDTACGDRSDDGARTLPAAQVVSLDD